MLALGIGANTTVFSGVTAIVLRPLPYQDPARLFMIRETRANADFARTVVSTGEFLQWAERRDLFDSVTAIDYPGVTVVAGGGADPETLSGLLAPASLFEVLHIRPPIGGALSADDDRPGQPLSVVISWDYWQRRFDGDAAAIGRVIRVNAQPATIIGVLPPRFAFNGPVDIVLPAQYDAAAAAAFDQHFLDVVGRLRPEVTRERAEAALSAFVRQHQGSPPHATGVALVPLKEEIVGPTGRVAWLLLAAVGCVLAIACANIANLLLARAVTRRREIAIRAALGAARRRIAAQLITESLILSSIAGALGVLLALWGVDLLVAVSPPGTPRLNEVRLDWLALAFASGLTLLTGILFGVAPALHAARVDVNDTLKVEGRGASGARQRTLRAFAVAEIAVALTLLVGATLLLESFLRLNRVDPGFAGDEVVTLNIAPPARAYSDTAKQVELYRRLLNRVAGVPGIASAALVNVLPLSGNNSSGGLAIEGRAASSPTDRPNANLRSITPDYFRTMGIAVLRGRGLQDADNASAPRVAVINNTMARRFWPNDDPIGKRVKRGRPESDTPWIAIVGIVGDVRHRSLRADARQEIYFPFEQQPQRVMVLTARAAIKPSAILSPLRAAIHGTDPDLPLDGLLLMRDVIAASLQNDRFSTAVVGSFATIAVLLAAIGIYGVISFAVAQRHHEIGVRMALGAQRTDVVRLVFRQALRLIAIGVGIGLAAAAALSRTLASLLYGLTATDAPTYAVAALLLTSVAICAISAPIYRATRINPMIALRE